MPHTDIPRLILDTLKEEGIPKIELARRMNTHRSTVTRLTHPDYHGHTLETLAKIAAALNRELNITLAPKEEQ